MPLIRSFFDRFRSVHAACATICQNYFCLCRCCGNTRRRRKNKSACAEIFPRVASIKEYHRCKKSLFHRCFCNRRKSCYVRASRSQRVLSRRASQALTRSQCASRGADTHIVKWSQCFFHCAVVNGMQCGSIHDRTDADIRHVSWLGGQQWRNVERRRPRRRRSSSRFFGIFELFVSKIASYGPGCVMVQRAQCSCSKAPRFR